MACILFDIISWFIKSKKKTEFDFIRVDLIIIFGCLSLSIHSKWAYKLNENDPMKISLSKCIMELTPIQLFLFLSIVTTFQLVECDVMRSLLYLNFLTILSFYLSFVSRLCSTKSIS